MIDPRIYRAAFLPALLATIALMLSVETAPAPLQPPPAGIAPAEFDAPRAGASPAEAALRDGLVALPGESERTVAIVAVRGSAGARDAATAALTELASVFESARHTKTLLLASTGASEGASGARDLLASQPAADRIEAVVTLSGADAGEPAGPEVLSESAGPQSTSAQLVETARAAVRSEVERQPAPRGPLDAFLGLAFPGGDGPQADLIAAGMDAVGIRGGDADELGRVALWLVTALDAAPREPIHGPAAWLPLSGNLLPGWGVALLALALLLPSALAALDALVRARRAPLGVPRDSIVPLAGLATVVVVAGIWLANPYLALLCVPLAHLWVVWPAR